MAFASPPLAAQPGAVAPSSLTDPQQRPSRAAAEAAFVNAVKALAAATSEWSAKVAARDTALSALNAARTEIQARHADRVTHLQQAVETSRAAVAAAEALPQISAEEA